MKILFIFLAVFLTAYLIITVIAIAVQVLLNGEFDQSSEPLGMIIKQSFGWPVILIKLL